jgi:hypothetical protein
MVEKLAINERNHPNIKQGLEKLPPLSRNQPHNIELS